MCAPRAAFTRNLARRNRCGFRAPNRCAKSASEIDPRMRLVSAPFRHAFGGLETGSPIPPPPAKAPYNDCRIMYIMENIRERRFSTSSAMRTVQSPYPDRAGFPRGSADMIASFERDFPKPPDAQISSSRNAKCRRFLRRESASNFASRSRAKMCARCGPCAVDRAYRNAYRHGSRCMRRAAIFLRDFCAEFRRRNRPGIRAGSHRNSRSRTRAPGRAQTSMTMPS